jgi:hypothetical protein
MSSVQEGSAWQAMWRDLAVLEDGARRLRRLSQEQPLLQPRPDYPRTRIGTSHADELRTLLGTITETLDDVLRLLPAALPHGAPPSAMAADETPPVIRERLASLRTLAATLATEAFEPPPLVPPHAPPYLASSPARGMPASRAVALCLALDGVVASLRNVMLGTVNAAGILQDGTSPAAGK